MNASHGSNGSQPNGRFRGPVHDLSKHVPEDWWATLFGPSYLLTDADVLTDDLTRAEVDRVVELLPLSPEAHILDLCCGQGRHALELARRGYRNVQGLDRSAFLIDTARSEATGENLDVCFQVGDCRNLPFEENTFDAVLLLGNSFGYFADPEDDQRVLAEVNRLLRSEGRIVLDLACGTYLRNHFEARSWEWLDDEHLACRERQLTEGDQRLVSRELLIHVRRGVLKDQFYAERIYDRHEIKEALTAAGYTDIRFGGTQRTISENAQDPGMMAERFWMTAQRSNGYDVPTYVPERHHIAVLLGDPRLPDETKLGGYFDEDDLEVVGRLKEALSTLDRFRFDYFDHHETLLDDLRRQSETYDLVFNLCDEGLLNRPKWELHVPALLEMLGMPYSGSGPQALAYCYDKSLVRGIAREMGVPVAEGQLLRPGADAPEVPSVGFPILVKPNTGDNSIGITQKSIASAPEELHEAIDQVREHAGPKRALLLERFLPGNDLTFGVIGNTGSFVAMPITEDDYSNLPEDLPPICGYEAKWLPDSPYWQRIRTVPAVLAEDVASTIRRESIRMFERLGCRDYARFDWRLDAEGKPHLLEVNPNPGWCWDGHLVVAASYAGYGYAGVLRLILEAALQRHHKEPVAL